MRLTLTWLTNPSPCHQHNCGSHFEYQVIPRANPALIICRKNIEFYMTLPAQPTENPVSAVIIPRARDIGDFEVRRALPAIELRSIGPFIFFDQMGPVVFQKPSTPAKSTG
jgi:hypothetical protein